ncbi:MAG: PKD domain-containing protein, partial [Thermoplasmata archaeon]|nr:PKD domain-containing protein [Thermoplasmata archaeon]
INVTISEIKLYSNDKWITLSTKPQTIDLNNKEGSFGAKKINEGDYTKLSLTFEKATGVLKTGGTETPFEIPVSNLTIQQDIQPQKGNNHITIEFDLNESVFSKKSVLIRITTYRFLPLVKGLELKYADGTTINLQGKEVKVENRKPVINEVLVNNYSTDFYVATVNETLVFNATDTHDGEGDVLQYHWDFGDGNNATGVVVNHTYTAKGRYTVTLTASDGQLEDSREIIVKVD